MIGVILDQLIGDPHRMPHPVRAIGKLIMALEKALLGDVSDGRERDAGKEKQRGVLLWFVVVAVTGSMAFLVLFVAYKISLYGGVILESVMTCYILAARSLCRESMLVYDKLLGGDLNAARYALSMIVGRDTENLDEEEVAKAAVETVAENTSDGVIAPFFYTALGGPVLGFIYKAVNTMDSMVGYKNERYENFGFFSAKADDVFNFIPSRISAGLMIAASFLLGAFSGSYSGKRAFEIWKRDRYNHKSPNSAQTESVCAGALGLKLGGTHLYKGVYVEKPTIGDEIKKTEVSDIKRANRLMFTTEWLMLAASLIILFCLIKIL